jgi:hypothetical protein
MANFKFGRLATAYFRSLPLAGGRAVSIDPTKVESLQAVNGNTWVRMTSGVLHISGLKKPAVAKLLGAKVR